MLGVAGSTHCAVMCAPVMLVFTAGAPQGAWRTAATYHAARIASYGLLGSMAGAAGRVADIHIGGRSASLVAGGVLIAIAASYFRMREPAVMRAIGRRIAAAMSRMGAQRTHTPLAATVAAGVLNAFLPCGLVYYALVGATGAGNAWMGAAFMAVFGAGTLPVLAAVWTTAASLSPRWRGRLRFATPIAIGLVGLLLIHRGLDAAPVSSAHGHMHGR